jgi:hypothetical protein
MAATQREDFPERWRNHDRFCARALIQFGDRTERIEAAHQAFLRAQVSVRKFREDFTGKRIHAGQHHGKARAHRATRVVKHSRSRSRGNFANHFNSKP